MSFPELQPCNTKAPASLCARSPRRSAWTGILEGSVNRSSNHVHINLQLIYAPTDTHVWARSYERDLNGTQSLPQEDAAGHCPAAAKVHSAPPKPQRYVSPEAHDAYLRGRDYWFSGNYERSKEYFDKAIRLQPDYALAWDGLGDSYGDAAEKTFIPAREAFEKGVAVRPQGSGVG